MLLNVKTTLGLQARKMTTYLCQKCHQEIDPAELETLPGIRCIICGHRILLKKRPPIIKRLKTD